MTALAFLATGALVLLLALAPAMAPRVHREVTAWCAALWFASVFLPALFR